MSQFTDTELRDPLVIAAFEGWNDAGDAASAAVDHLLATWEAHEVASMDTETYHDFQVNRPILERDENGQSHITWPTTRVYIAHPQGSDRDVIIVRGVEPSMRWKSFTAELMDTLHELGATMLVALGSMLADVPHTRPLPVASTTDDEALMARLALEPNHYEGPTGIVGVLMEGARRRHLPALSLWAALPHYVAQGPAPKASLALLDRIEELLGVPIPLGDLPEESEAWEHAVSSLAEEDEEIAGYVNYLEEEKDTTELPQASGDAIARDFERYLRRRTEKPHRGSTSAREDSERAADE